MDDLSREATGVPSVAEIEARADLDDHTGVVALSKARLEVFPHDMRTRRLLKQSEDVLEHMYLAKIGGPKMQLRVLMSLDQLQWLSIDHRAGYLLSRIEGPTTVSDVLEISSMSRLDTLRLLHELLQQQVIGSADP